jgi:hypothetical protein
MIALLTAFWLAAGSARAATLSAAPETAAPPVALAPSIAPLAAAAFAPPLSAGSALGAAPAALAAPRSAASVAAAPAAAAAAASPEDAAPALAPSAPALAAGVSAAAAPASEPRAAAGAAAASPAAALFDGAALHPLLKGESTDLALEGLRYRGGALSRGGVKAAELGRGMRGVVHAHPAIEGAVVKTVAIQGEVSPIAARTGIMIAPPNPREVWEREAESARRLADAGAGPRYFGAAVIDGRLASVRERVYGDTVEALSARRAYGPEEHALVLALVDRLAAAGIHPSDHRAANIMIGRTAADPARRAYLVDGGFLHDADASRGLAERAADVLDSYVSAGGGFAVARTLRAELQRGLDRAARRDWRARVVDAARALLAPRAKPVPPPANEAERLDREFAPSDVWAAVAPDARAEIEGLRARRLSKAQLKEYVRREADAAFARIKAARGTSNVGLHYNLHGGARASYVGAGIRAAKGDIALRYTMNGDLNDKVYFFQTAAASPYDALDASNGEILLFPSRMGYVLSAFAVDAPELAAAMGDGRIANVGAISMDFHKGMRGVPYSTFLAPPLEVFVGTAKKLGLRRLSRDEETLATVRFLEAALTAGGAYVPGGKPASPEAAAAGAAARSLAARAAAPLTAVAPRFKLVDNAFFYHGTTWSDLVRTVQGGGEMTPDTTQFSLRARDSVGYASERQRKLNREDNPTVLLQFRADDLSPFVSNEQFRPAMAVALDMRMPPMHAAYAAAVKPVPLALMTPESKESILSWLRAQAASRPDQPRWAQLLPQFERALGAGPVSAP